MAELVLVPLDKGDDIFVAGCIGKDKRALFFLVGCGVPKRKQPQYWR